MLHRFAGFELDEERYELRRDGAPIELQPKVLEVLLYLVRNPERACSKDELLDAVWADANVGEGSLVRCIAVARRALDETEGEARIIHTVRGRGYRIGVPVETGPKEAPAEVDAARSTRRARGLWLTCGALALVLASLFWLARPYADLPEPSSPTFGAEHPVTTVAVVPGLAADAGTETLGLADGVALQLIDRLGTIAELRVVSHAAALEVARHGPREPREVGRRLAAGTLVFERVQHRGDDTRLTIEVVDASSGFQRWSRSYEGRVSETRDLGEVASEDVARVVGILIQAGPGFLRQTGKASALEYYMGGREAVYAASRERLLEAVSRYEQAIELDPSYVDAYVALTDAYERLWDLNPAESGWLDRGEIAILKARELDPGHEYAVAMHATLLRARRRWAEAEAGYLRAIELGASGRTYALYASMLCMLGRTSEAEPLVARALGLAPLDAEVQRTAGRVHHYLGNHERAVAHLLRALELDPRAIFTPRLLAGALASNGQENEAREAFLLLAPSIIRPFARVHGRLFGAEASVRLLLTLDIARTGKSCRGDGHGTAMAWAFVGERQRMLDCLAEDVDRHLYYVVEDPVFDPYRDDPQFQELLLAAGLPVGGS